MNTHDLYNAAFDKWGGDAVIAKAIEECGELISVLAKHSLNEDVYGFAAAKIVDEIADVTIMMQQMRLIFGCAYVDARIREKLERLKSLVDNDD